MRRCKDIQGGGLILAVCLCAGVALADIWPSWLSPAQGSYDRGNQAMSGAVERLTVSVGPDAWTNYITTNIWAGYFSQASKLRASKNMFKAALNGATWVRPVTNYTPETAQTVTESNILAWCGAPAGWWTNHPYGNIANSSNGWRFLPDVASNLVWLSESRGSVAYTNTITASWSDTNNYSSFANAWSALVLQSIVTNGSSGEGGWSCAFLRNYTATTNYYLQAERSTSDRYWDYASGQFTNIGAMVEMWLKTFPVFPSYDIWDSQGDLVSETKLKYQEWERTAGDSMGPSVRIGDTGDLTIPPNWTWYTNNPTTDQYLGWSLDSDYSPATYLHRFNATTNGFKWFR